MRIKHPLDLGGDLVTLPQDLAEALGQAGQDRLRRGGAGDDDGLLVQGGHDLLDEPVTHAGRVDGGDREHFATAGFAQTGRSAAAGQQFQHGLVLHSGAEDPFQSGVDLGQQAPDPVGYPGGFAGEVVVEADEDFQLGQDLVAGVDPPQRAWQGAGRVGDDVAPAENLIRSGRNRCVGWTGCRSRLLALGLSRSR